MLRGALAALALLLLPFGAAQERLSLAIPEEPDTLDPAVATVDSALMVTGQIYETLFRITGEGEIRGLLAANWSYASATRLTVSLVPDVSFSDGAPLDAAAVQASLTRFLDPGTHRPDPTLLAPVIAVEVQDATTVVIVTSQPFAPLTAHLAHPSTAIVPGGHGRDLHTRPVGSGPFQLVEWLPATRLTLQSNPDYWGGPPPISELEFLVDLSPQDLVTRLSSGALHGAYQLPAAVLEDLRERPGVHTTVRTGWSAVQLGVNSTNPKLAPLGVRQALALALDKGSLIEAVPGGLAEPAVAALPPTVRLVPPPTSEPYPYEPEAARALLHEEGRPVTDLTLDLMQDPELEAVAQALKRTLAEVGLTLQVRVLPPDLHQAQLQSPDLQLFLTRWNTTTFDPDQTLFRALHSTNIPTGNAARYRVAAVDALLQEARNSTSDTVRAADYLDVLETVLTDLPVITLYYPQYVVAKATALTGEELGPAWYLLDLRHAALQA